MMNKIAILGAGHIGRALVRMLGRTDNDELRHTNFIVIDKNPTDLDWLNPSIVVSCDFEIATIEDISELLQKEKITHIVNSLPFFLNEKIANAAVLAKCHYIDFTEDDIMAKTVQEIYKDKNLTCIVKCGLAPGFINYLGHSMVKDVSKPESLMISVGALPRHISYTGESLENTYNLTWSIDGLVNEYLKPCKVKVNKGHFEIVQPLSNLIKIKIDGCDYEASYTSGGVGSLIDELDNVPKISYMTLRYPGHFEYVKSIINGLGRNFNKIKEVFQKVFSYTDNDVVVVYAETTGNDKSNRKIKKTYANKFYGVDGMTAIQTTTAGAGMAVLELIVNSQLSGIKNHKDISIGLIKSTDSFKKYYPNF